MAESDRYLALIKRNAASAKGSNIIVVDTVNGVYSPAAGTKTGAQTLTGACRGIAVPYTNNSFDTEKIDGESILSGDRKLIIASDALLFEPSTTSKITMHGAEWRIVGITNIMIGDIKIGYKMQLRK